MLKKVKSGFSLVELSLVLIIVALIISAVVSGKSLVQNSKLTLLHSEMQTLKIALGNYINDNQLGSFAVGTDINLYNLMDEGYLENKTVTTFNGSEITSGDTSSVKNKKSNIFKSKYSGGVWQYAGNASDVIVNFGKAPDSETEDVGVLLTGLMAKNFQVKYQKSGSIMMKDKTGTQYTGGTTQVVLTVYFLNGAQN